MLASDAAGTLPKSSTRQCVMYCQLHTGCCTMGLLFAACMCLGQRRLVHAATCPQRPAASSVLRRGEQHVSSSQSRWREPRGAAAGRQCRRSPRLPLWAARGTSSPRMGPWRRAQGSLRARGLLTWGARVPAADLRPAAATPSRLPPPRPAPPQVEHVTPVTPPARPTLASSSEVPSIF